MDHAGCQIDRGEQRFAPKTYEDGTLMSDGYSTCVYRDGTGECRGPFRTLAIAMEVAEKWEADCQAALQSESFANSDEVNETADALDAVSDQLTDVKDPPETNGSTEAKTDQPPETPSV